jgi:Flp pilus assembly protein TadG
MFAMSEARKMAAASRGRSRIGGPLLREEGGSALVEFAVFISVLVLIFLGVADYAFFIKAKMELQDAVASAAAYGSVPGNEGNFTQMVSVATTQIQGVSNPTVSAVNTYACSAGGTAVTASSLCTGNVTPYKFVVVTASATVPRSFVYPGIPASLVMTATASYRVEWTN